MKRTSLNIDELVFREIKLLASKHGISQTRLIKVLLNDGIQRFKAAAEKKSSTLRIPTTGQGGFWEDIDLSERSRMWDLIDNRKEKLGGRN